MGRVFAQHVPGPKFDSKQHIEMEGGWKGRERGSKEKKQKVKTEKIQSDHKGCNSSTWGAEGIP